LELVPLWHCRLLLVPPSFAHKRLQGEGRGTLSSIGAWRWILLNDETLSRSKYLSVGGRTFATDIRRQHMNGSPNYIRIFLQGV
jgi:hypothetical protein